MNRDAARELLRRLGSRPETPLNPDRNPWLVAVAVGVVLSYVVVVVAGGIWWSSQDSDATRVAAGAPTATQARPVGTAPVGTTTVTVRPGTRPSATDPGTTVLGAGATNSAAGTNGNGNADSTSTTTGGATDPDPDPGTDPEDNSTTTVAPSTIDTEPPTDPTTSPDATTTMPTETPSTAPPTIATLPTSTTSSVTTTTTATPPLVVSLRVTPSVVEAQRWEMDAVDAPVLTWSVDPVNSLNGHTVKVTGPDTHGFTDMTPSGRRTLCPGTVVAGTCTRSVGEWTYTLTVSDPGGTVIDTRTATLTVL